ncbi:imidazolonepropionase [Bacillus sp. 1P06AnD]|uniref:imidazolonepropionase n=1 Tax=Bacillus sp. 1P06AnD TaxID=3132208 RepID=UPI0039A0DA04
MYDTLFTGIGELLLPDASKSLLKGEKMKSLRIIKNTALAVMDGKVAWIGEENGLLLPDAKEIIDAGGKVVSPGLIDCHTHLVHGGSRENELDLKQKGIDYLKILESGGGILSTVRATREATEEELVEKAQKHVKRMVQYGVTAIECKSGYGLDAETEMKQLRALQRLKKLFPVKFVSTFLGPHAIPEEYKGKNREFISLMISVMEEAVEKGLIDFADIFCERGVFTLDDSRWFLQKAKELGLGVKIHCDEIVSLGGTELAVELGAVSADHVVAASDKAIKMLSLSKTVAVLLPGTTFYLGKNEYARARDIIDQGGAVALATDFNPGSCVTENLQMIMSLAALRLKMTAEEIWNAVTVNAAYAVGLAGKAGGLEIGMPADLVIWDIPTYQYLPYHFGVNHAKDVFIRGKKY